MRRARRIRLGVATALGCGLVMQAAVAQPAAAPDYRVMFVKSGKQSVQATLGAYCHPADPDPANCSKGPSYPLKTTGRLTLKRGAKVTLLFRGNAGDVTWRAARIDGRGQEKLTASGVAGLVTKRSKRRWQITLPKNVSLSSDLLGFDVQYPNAYSSFEVGLKVRR
ncbi:MAG: hypothetical protein M3417_10645 [Actinomycetota bacterium]|nr:hypothetical protein [Actinomycetota bacterium]